MQVPAAEAQGGILHAMRRLGRHGAGCGVSGVPIGRRSTMSWLKHLGKGKRAAPERKAPLGSRLGDWTGDYRDASRYAEGFLEQLTLPGEITALAFEPGMGYLAVGTAVGTVHLYGAPGVRMTLTLRPPLKVKHLLFKSDTYLLVCIDEKNNMSMFDLSRRDPMASAVTKQGWRTVPGSSGRAPTPSSDAPMRVAIHSARNQVLCTEVTASHSHLFLGLADGTVETYDLERLVPAPYKIPNLWWHEEEVLRRSGVPGAPSRLHVPLLIDIQTHPKDLNLLLLCYEGGAILYSLRDQSAMLTFQLRLLPGAPGPCADDPPEVIWTERLCSATAIAWSPDGDVFAMGHENGAISFWTLKDEDKPLLVRTLDEVDIDRPVAPEERPQRPSAGPREPIFKLAWSGLPAHGWYETEKAPGSVLTVMGGTPVRGSAASLATFAFASAPSVGLWTTTTLEANAKARAALRSNLEPMYTVRYATSSTVDDFVLLPRINPHYGGTYDPYAVVVLVGSDASLPTLPVQLTHRGVEAFSFPPHPTAAYERLELPLPLLCAGRGTVLGARFDEVPVAQYRELVAPRHAQSMPVGSVCPTVPMGGYAKPKLVHASPAHAGDIARAGGPRLLVTWHLDGCVRVYDASPHLLLLGDEDTRRGTVLPSAFPAPLPHLTVSVRSHVLHPSVIGSPALAPLQRAPMHIEVADVRTAWDAKELAVVLTSGHVLHLAFAAGMQSSSQVSEALQELSLGDASGGGSSPEFTPMDSTRSSSSPLAFQPNTVLQVLPGHVSCSALSDVGLVAVASGCSLVVADVCNHDIVVRAGCGAADFYSRQIGQRELVMLESEARSEITWLTFAVCRTALDDVLALRLLVGRASGFVTVWSFERGALDGWLGFRSDAVKLAPLGRPALARVLDPLGVPAAATTIAVERAAYDQGTALNETRADHSRDFHVLVLVGEHGIVVVDQVTGGRVASTELYEAAQAATIVTRAQAKVLCVAGASSLHVFSLPRLDTSHRVQRHVPGEHDVGAAPPMLSLSSQGEFIELSAGQLRLWTACAPQPHGDVPSMFLFTPRTLPLSPGAAAGSYIASLGSGLGTSAATSLSYGAQIDAVLAGPRRPPAPKGLPPRIAPTPEAPEVPLDARRPTASGSAVATASKEGTQGAWYEPYQRSLANLATSSGASRVQAQINMQLLHKRDELLSSCV